MKFSFKKNKEETNRKIDHKAITNETRQDKAISNETNTIKEKQEIAKIEKERIEREYFDLIKDIMDRWHEYSDFHQDIIILHRDLTIKLNNILEEYDKEHSTEENERPQPNPQPNPTTKSPEEVDWLMKISNAFIEFLSICMGRGK